MKNPKVVTRFCPTLSTGPLHIGHTVNAFANLLYARKHHGRFFVKALFVPSPSTDPSVFVPDDYDYQTKEWRCFAQNLVTIKWLFPGVPLVTSVECQALVLCACRDLFDYAGLPALRRIGNVWVLEAAIDLLMGTTMFIRGQDWNGRFDDPGSRAYLCGESGLLLNAAFKKLGGRAPEQLFHPLLVDSGGRKISKQSMMRGTTLDFSVTSLVDPSFSKVPLRWTIREHSLEPLREQFTRMDLLAYAANVLGWDRRKPLFEWADDLDLASVQDVHSVEFNPAALRVCSEWVGRELGDDADQLYLDLIEGIV